MDCEFGGLDSEIHDITEIAIVLTDYRLAEISSREWKIKARPDRISKEARGSAAIPKSAGRTLCRSARY